MTTNLDQFYAAVMGRVIADVSPEFHEKGLTPQLQTLRTGWERRLQASGALHELEPPQSAWLPLDRVQETTQYDTPRDVEQLLADAVADTEEATKDQRERLPAVPRRTNPVQEGEGSRKRSRTLLDLNIGGSQVEEEKIEEVVDVKGEEEEIQVKKDADSEGEELGSDLDDVEGDGEPAKEAKDVLVCQYEKVTHAKARWRCVLRDGLTTLQGRDFALKRIVGEMEFV